MRSVLCTLFHNGVDSAAESQLWICCGNKFAQKTFFLVLESQQMLSLVRKKFVAISVGGLHKPFRFLLQ